MDTITVKIPKYFRDANMNELRCHFVDAFCRFYENGVFIKGNEVTSSQLSTIAYTQGLLYCLLAKDLPPNKDEVELPESCRYRFLIEGKTGFNLTLEIINKVWDCFIWSYHQNEGGLEEIQDFYRLVGLRDALIQFVTSYFSEWLATKDAPKPVEEPPFV